jgi:outer membrane protein TolC
MTPCHAVSRQGPWNRLDLALVLSLVAGLAWAEAGPPAELGPQDAVAAALANQPQLKAAASRSEAAAAHVRQLQWNRLGSLETVLLYTPALRPLSVDFPGIPPYVPPSSFEVRQLDTYALSASLTQPLFTWGALAGERAAARSEEVASRHSLERARQQATFEARRAFYRAAAAVAALGVSERNLEQQGAFLEAARSRERAGAAPHLDVLKAELAVTRAESTLGEVRNAERIAREALVTATMDPQFRAAILRVPDDLPEELPGEEEAVARALAGRPDLMALDRQADALSLAARATLASARPSLSLRATITQQNDVAGDLFDKDSQLYQANLVVAWDGVQAVRSRPQAEELRATERSVREGRRGVEEAVALEVRAALLSAREAGDRVHVESRALAVAEEQARVSRLAYGEGLATASEAQDSELALTAARFGVLRARLDVALARAALAFAVGE